MKYTLYAVADNAMALFLGRPGRFFQQKCISFGLPLLGNPDGLFFETRAYVNKKR